MPLPNRLSTSSTERLVESAARTTDGDTGALNGWGGVSTIRAQLNVTALDGTAPAVTVRIEDSLDGVNWNTLATFAARNTVGREVINITTPFASMIRVAWDVTESATFNVIAYAQ